MTSLTREPMRTIVFIFFFCLVYVSTMRARGPRWWKLPYKIDPTTFMNNEILSNSLHDHHLPEDVQVLLRKKQRRLSRENQGVLLAVSNGTKQAMHECKHQFEDRRWNCTHFAYGRSQSLYGKIVSVPCRETAFIYALTAASIVHAVTRGCTEGSIQSCSCDFKSHDTQVSGYSPLQAKAELHLMKQAQNNLHSRGTGARSWQWGGCSENVEFGYRFSKEFVNAGERGWDLRSVMNLHNNEAGRKQVKLLMRLKCKCHGMSGSCTIKSCWWRLPHLRKIGAALKDRFDRASKVRETKEMIARINDKRRSTRRRNSKRKKKSRSTSFRPAFGFKFPSRRDLIYTDPSPNFCYKNKKLGFTGTQGRTCNVTSKGIDGCSLMCCGRGYTTEVRQVQEMCLCTFHWCCEVKCRTCIKTKIIHSCR